jgi:hypothetical protein
MDIFESIYHIEFDLNFAFLKDKFGALKENLEAIIAQKDHKLDENRIPLYEIRNEILTEFIKAAKDVLKQYPNNKELLKAISDKVTSFKCGEKPAISACDGGYDDDDNIKECGSCIRPLFVMFDFVAEMTRANYFKFSSLYRKKEHSKDMVLSTFHDDKKPHQFYVNYNVSGFTEFHSGREGKDISEIKLILCLKKFTPNSYLSILYVLFHECVCHAFENIIRFGERRLSFDTDHPFSEGWMDWVAFLMMKKMLGQHGSYKISKNHIEIAEKFHKSRVDYEYQPYKDSGQQYRNILYRAQGKQAAELMYDFIKRCMTDENKCWEKFLNISFELNITQSTHIELEKFVEKLIYYLNLESIEHPITEVNKAKVRHEMRKYIDDTDPKQLYYYVLDHPSSFKYI